MLVGCPGKGHLFSFKELLYDNPAPRGPVPMLAEESGFELIDTHVIRYPLSLRGPGQVMNLLLMTPFIWSADDDARTQLAALNALDTEVEVIVHTYRRTESAPAATEKD